MSVEVKWENFMIAHKNRELQKTVSVDNLLSLSLDYRRPAYSIRLRCLL